MSRDFILPGVEMSFKECIVVGSQGSYGYSVWFDFNRFVVTAFQSSSYGSQMKAVRTGSTITIMALKSGYFMYVEPISNGDEKTFTKKYFEAGATILSFTLTLSNLSCVVLAI